MFDRMAYLLPLLVAIGFECITVFGCTLLRAHADVLKESIKAQSKKAEDDNKDGKE